MLKKQRCFILSQKQKAFYQYYKYNPFEKKQYFIMQYCIMFKSQIRQLNRNTLYINAKQKHQPKIEKKQANLVKLSDRKGKKRE